MHQRSGPAEKTALRWKIPPEQRQRIQMVAPEKAAVERLAEWEERAPNVVVRRLVIATWKAEGLL
jgi:hypothetical protein